MLLTSLTLPLLLWACQGDLYPVAPDVPERVTSSTPAPGVTPQRGNYGGQLVSTGSHALEFLGFTPRDTYTLYLFPWDSALNPIPYSAETTAVLKLPSGREIPLTTANNREDGSLYFYAQPEPSFEQQDVTLQAEVTLGGTTLTGSFRHPGP
jgi:hypothetical protein